MENKGEYMLEILDKTILFLLCSTLYLHHYNTIYVLLPMILMIIGSCFCTYFENRKLLRFGTFFYAILSTIHPHFLFYMPLQLYDIFLTQEQKYSLIYLIPLFFYSGDLPSGFYAWIFIFCLLSFTSKGKKDRILELSHEYYTYQDTAKELEISLEEKNRRLIQNQDDKIHLATLQERNRIAKEIHDNTGHLLSRSLLQIGALMIITKDKVLLENLKVLKDSLSVGMDNIRSSIHNLHDESVDLYASINTLVKEFTFCPITFDYHLKNTPTTQLKYFFLWTIKESLSNVTKHSNATKVSIVLMEHPIMYQLIITNNGNSILDENMYLSDGIGLRTMRERTHAFKGIFQVSTEKGFRIFITIPIKNEEVVNNESTCD